VKQLRLPNGLMIAAANRPEVAFLYDEIIGQDAYFRHGLTLPPGGCVFDVGANIGLFTLAITRREPTLEVHAFEPVPAIYRLLALNAERHFPRTVLHNVGLGAAPGVVPFAYYPRCSGWSTRYPDHRGTRRDLAAYARHRGAARSRWLGPVLGRVAGGAIARYLLHAEEVRCRVLPLSTVIVNCGVATIDLLKIDVERAELDVLDGIAAQDWPRIRQLAIEVHDVEDRVRRVADLLRARGFEPRIDQLSALRDTSLHMIYARRLATGG
jgi:FkbM family methyltransferase